MLKSVKLALVKTVTIVFTRSPAVGRSAIQINWSVESRGTAMFSDTQHRTSLKLYVGDALGPRHGSNLLATNIA